MVHIKYSITGAMLVLALSADVCSGQRTEPGRDPHGDALPAGAVARLGSLRWRHNAPVRFVAFAPDGRSVISAGNDGFFRVRDFPSGKELRRFGREISPSHDRSPGGHLLYHHWPQLSALSKDGKTAAMRRPLSGIGPRRWDCLFGRTGHGQGAPDLWCPSGCKKCDNN
jgi:WD40 repeat protein